MNKNNVRAKLDDLCRKARSLRCQAQKVYNSIVCRPVHLIHKTHSLQKKYKTICEKLRKVRSEIGFILADKNIDNRTLKY